MSKLMLFALVLIGVTVVASTSRSDDLGPTTETPPSVDLSFPATVPQGPNPPHDMVTQPFDIGPPQAAWSYEQLSAAEKAVVDHGRQPLGAQADLDAYNAAMAKLAAQSNAVMSARMLGVDGLGDVGVIP
ncbi:MAG: hypothetical protein SFX73_31565 [Kofleriaceae bacterium]|nr:hypothetical protein [Kofleriaceae bacterium]